MLIVRTVVRLLPGCPSAAHVLWIWPDCVSSQRVGYAYFVFALVIWFSLVSLQWSVLSLIQQVSAAYTNECHLQLSFPIQISEEFP